ncbi:hypothetical protein [Photobacterium aquimaris]|nr:hypothetical protein [Photobacterium aquimaris]MCP4956657.1 hypothetical protein [Photobacterium aquimaris]
MAKLTLVAGGQLQESQRSHSDKWLSVLLLSLAMGLFSSSQINKIA